MEGGGWNKKNFLFFINLMYFILLLIEFKKQKK
jgi:hypothetical protein